MTSVRMKSFPKPNRSREDLPTVNRLQSGSTPPASTNNELDRLYHGGGPELWRGKLIRPGMAQTRYHKGCAQCDAQRSGTWMPGTDPATPHGWVYATTDREYARYYASRAGAGWLYEVEPVGNFEPSTEDLFPTWRAAAWRVLRVVEKRITLTMTERRALFVRWGGTEAEFSIMLRSVGAE